jgi:tripartite-type tricarboxylate transporter receptor subunit TctC
MNLMRRRFLQLAGAAAAAPVLPPRASALDYPTRPVRFIVPLAPGGGLDFVARLTSEHMSRAIGQQVYIENKLGAGGMIGIETAAKSPPDGYSVLITNDNVASAPHVLSVNTDYVRDLAPVIELSRQTLVLAVHNSFAAKSVDDLIKAAKARPGLSMCRIGEPARPSTTSSRATSRSASWGRPR